ncbi:LysE family translocator [Psychromonas hadalis]|uniref:LysE family translocator n=1 Tax=Psychromonas hadalis TaxID=211669 RepID=UPI0003B4ABD6|nr:LysE family transporter [Psychromonas hadalis]
MVLLINTFMAEIIAVTSIAILMAVIPGVDFVMVTRTSIRNGRLAGLYTTLGVCLSICIHASYSIAGLAVVIANSEWLFSIIKYAGAAYLMVIAWQLLTTRALLNNDQGVDVTPISHFGALRLGFISNILNPKAPIFFISIFTQVVSLQTPLIMQIGYGLIIVLAHLIWFGCVALLLSQPSLLPRFNKHKQKIDKGAGILLILFAVNLSFMAGG